MAVTLPELPYKKSALEPYISGKTLDFHYGKHHAGYVEKLNSLIAKTELSKERLEDIIKNTAGDDSKTAIFNNAAQVWNHSFYWQCMKPGAGSRPKGILEDKIGVCFGSYDKFVEQLKNAGLGQFGSGWVWLLLKENNLEIMKTSNADTPIARGLKPLLTIDVWEHAYYLDYQNKRGNYLEAVIENLLNWDFVQLNMGDVRG